MIAHYQIARQNPPMDGEKKTNMSKILLLENDLSLINGLSFAFKKQGFESDIARTIKEANILWADGKYGYRNRHIKTGNFWI